MLTRCVCNNTTAAGHREASQVPSFIITRPAYCPGVIKKHLVNILHPPCSGWVSEQLYYIGTSTDPLSAREGLACETRLAKRGWVVYLNE